MDDIIRVAKPRAAFGRADQTRKAPARPRMPEFQPQPPIASLPGTMPASPTELAPVAPPVPQSGLDRGHIVAGSFALMRRNAVTFLALIAAAAVPERVTYHLMGTDDPNFAVLQVLTALSCLALYAAMFDGATRDLCGQPVAFGDCLRGVLRTPFAAFGAISLTVFSVWFLLIVPGIGFATRWAVAAPVAILEGRSLRDALARSTAMTAPCRPQVRILVLMLAGLGISRAFTMMPVWGMPMEALPVFFFGNWLFPLLLTGFTAAAGAMLYHTLNKAQAGSKSVPPA